jgi:hypothetical protein
LTAGERERAFALPRHIGDGPYTELVFEPMQEVLRYLRANGYKTYIARR